jgi:hypothetical protein
MLDISIKNNNKKRYVVYLSQKLIDLIEVESKQKGVSKSKIVRKIIGAYKNDRQ